LATSQFTVEHLKSHPEVLDVEERRIRKFLYEPNLKLVQRILD
jgi:hypothetical protein